MAGTVALIVAAGRGHRMGAALPKQYLPLLGHRVLSHAVAAFARLSEIDSVCVAIHPDDRTLYDDAVAPLGRAQSAKLLEPVAGGPERQDSVLNGLESLEPSVPGIVLIHDGARPAVDGALIRRTIAALEGADGADGAIAAVPVSDTLKRAGDDPPRIAGTVERSGLWRAQTPQTFRFAAILAAHRKARGQNLTDDAAIAEAAGLSVALVPGSEDNLKVTTADDLARAERILGGASRETRVGSGFDAHRFGPGDRVMLCGVAVAHDHGLVGHSDGDAGLHALTDAVLGALGRGDIGDHFPSDDPAWRDANSALFARRALEFLREARGEIVFLDVTMLCEAPRLAPHREAMRRRIAEIFAIAPSRVSVKATTTDGLGFLGRGEGIAAQATATLALPSATP